MRLLFEICRALSFGIIVGFLLGGFKSVIRRKSYTEEEIRYTKKLTAKAAGILKYITFFLLAMGLLWCSYFLILAVADPGQAEYADNMAELIVSVLTVISILFAFVEFLRRADDKDK